MFLTSFFEEDIPSNAQGFLLTWHSRIILGSNGMPGVKSVFTMCKTSPYQCTHCTIVLTPDPHFLCIVDFLDFIQCLQGTELYFILPDMFSAMGKLGGQL